MKTRRTKNLTACHHPFPKSLRLNMQNNSAPRRIKALLVRLHVTKHGVATTERIPRSNTSGMHCRGFATLSSDFPISNTAPRPRKFHLSIRRLATTHCSSRMTTRAIRPSDSASSDCYSATSLFPIWWATSHVSRRVPSYRPDLLLSAARRKLALQARFLLQMSLILKSDNFFTVSIPNVLTIECI